MSTDQTDLLTLGTPIVLDLSGTGIKTASINNGVSFDLFGVGQNVNTGWVTPSDGVLVYDPTGSTNITGANLFGSGTTMANGQKAANGYQALAALDVNHTGTINASDPGFSDLMVWVDSNSDGTAQASELHSLSSLGITQLNLNYQVSNQTDNGNLIDMVSSYVTSDGSTHEMADVTFATSMSASQATAAAAASGKLAPSVATAPVLGTVATPPVTGTAATVVASSTPLTSNVGGLVNALASYSVAGTSTAAAGVGATASLATTGTTSATAGSVASVAGMVTALGQFNANGQAVTGTGSLATQATVATLNTSTVTQPVTNILATPTKSS